MRLHLIRHAQSQSNAEGRIQGHLDVPLSEQGRSQAALLAERLGAMPITALYSSPLQRARTTADAVASKLGIEVVEREFLMERDVGEIAGLTGPEVGERYPAWRQKRYLEFAQDIVPGYEGDDVFRERVIPNMLALIEAHPEDEIAVITHGGVIGAFYRHVLGITKRGTFSIANAALSTYEVRNGDAAKGQILTLNDACHLNA